MAGRGEATAGTYVTPAGLLLVTPVPCHPERSEAESRDLRSSGKAPAASGFPPPRGSLDSGPAGLRSG